MSTMRRLNPFISIQRSKRSMFGMFSNLLAIAVMRNAKSSTQRSVISKPTGFFRMELALPISSVLKNAWGKEMFSWRTTSLKRKLFNAIFLVGGSLAFIPIQG